MYPDIKRIRNNRVMVRMDDYEHALVVSIANYQGESVATIVRQIVMKEAMAVLAQDNSLPRSAA
jgi:predicted HicB family RNase H-like nuclease